jgi:hypothetical protein
VFEGVRVGGVVTAGFVVQRTLPGGDSLYHAVALSLEYARDGQTPGMFSPHLPRLAISLREAAVEVLGEASRLLHLGRGTMIASADLVSMAARRRLGSRASTREYLKSVYELGEYSGGAELVALVNHLGRVAHVYKPRMAAPGAAGALGLAPGAQTDARDGARLVGALNGGDGRRPPALVLERMASIGEPAFSECAPMHLLALDSLEWRCDDDVEGIVAVAPDPNPASPNRDTGRNPSPNRNPDLRPSSNSSPSPNASSRAAPADGSPSSAAAPGVVDRGVQFHALLPAQLPTATQQQRARGSAVVAEDEELASGSVGTAGLTATSSSGQSATEQMRARVASSPEALAAIMEAARDPRFAQVIAEVACDPSRAAEHAKDPKLAPVLALLLAKVRAGE